MQADEQCQRHKKETSIYYGWEIHTAEAEVESSNNNSAAGATGKGAEEASVLRLYLHAQWYQHVDNSNKAGTTYVQ